jgi:hypothetical protein
MHQNQKLHIIVVFFFTVALTVNSASSWGIIIGRLPVAKLSLPIYTCHRFRSFQ